MPSQRVLQSVAHNLGHHAVSGLCYVVPHLARAALRSGQLAVTIDLLAEVPLPSPITPDDPLRLSVAALREQFRHILYAEGLTPDAVSAARITFLFERRLPLTPTVVKAQSRAQAIADVVRDPAYHWEAEVIATNGRHYHQSFILWVVIIFLGLILNELHAIAKRRRRERIEGRIASSQDP